MEGNNKSNNKSKKILIVIILMVLLISSTFIRYFSNSSSAVIATEVEKTLGLISSNNPIYSLLDVEISKKSVKRAIIEARRFEEEEKIRLQKINNKKEELLRKEEERKREEEKRMREEEILRNSKIAYLTFDDGPSLIVTPAILDILKSYDIKATFFVLGKMAAINPDILKRIHNDGHSIGHHSYSHNYNYIYKNIDNFLEEINKTDNLFKDIIGDEFETKLLRLPGGSFEKYKHKYVKAAEEAGYTNYDWNALNGDAESVQPTKDRLISRLKSTIKDRKEVIILMHDTDTKVTTVDTLPEIIEYLIGKGYIFRPLD